jgi:hypothetical protein
MNTTTPTAITLGVVALIVTGCATTPVSTASAQEVPRSQVLNTSFLDQREGFGQVIVKRDQGFSGSACRSRVFANGTAVAEIGTGEKITFFLPEGDQMLGAIAAGICGGGLVEAKVSVSHLRSAVFRISYGSSGDFSIQPTAF